MKRTVLDFGLVGLLGLALAAGCSSSGGSTSGSGGSQGNGSGGNSSSGGSNGSGGSSNGSGGSTSSGGSTGSGGSSEGSGGSTGSGGSSATACAAATGDLITDFGSGTAQVGMPYFGADTGLNKPVVDTSGGALTIMLDSGTATTMYPYAYVGLPFNACTDASAYKGVKFNISGTVSSGCTVQFSTVDKEHNTVANNGTCDPTTATNMSCYASSMVFTLSSDPTDVTVNFADQTGGGADPSAAVVDPAQVLNVQWQFNVPAMGSCTAMVTIKNVSFVK